MCKYVNLNLLKYLHDPVMSFCILRSDKWAKKGE